MYNITHTAGPCLSRDGQTYYGACAQRFAHGIVRCVNLSNGACTDKGVGNPRAIPDTAKTPDWCPYLADMIEDARMMDFFADRKLSASKKKDVLAVIRTLPKHLVPKHARSLPLRPLHDAIRAAWASGWEPPE